MITRETLSDVRTEIDRYLKADKALEAKLFTGDMSWKTLSVTGCNESAAVRRARLDLSRALTELRRTPGRQNK